jgi:RNA polymerase sigma-70 factor (ECF subfamily)
MSSQWLQQALERYEGPLLRYALRMTGNLEKAREVVQDTFLKLWETDPKTVDSHLAPWLYTVCRNRVLDVLKKEKRMQPLKEPAEGYELEAPDIGPAERYEKKETHSVLFQMVDTLPQNQREVIRLKFQDDLSYKEIAEVLGLSVGNVGFLLHTAIQAIRQKLATLEGATAKTGGLR